MWYKFINKAMGPQKATICPTNGLEMKVRVKSRYFKAQIL